ncbi:MAG: HAMP domain-containing protein [Alphaproteobacteria bacterium]|nr:HAMP domain-containing protein [Alphaproteobacteria bacterium]
MVLDTATGNKPAEESKAARTPKQRRRHGWWLWQHQPDGSRRVSPLALRILAVNSLALAILVGSLLYLGRYEERLIQSEIESLGVEAHIFSNALGEGAVILDYEERSVLSPELSSQMVRRLVEASDARMRLFDSDGSMVADSRVLAGTGRRIQIVSVDEVVSTGWLSRAADTVKGWLAGILPKRHGYPRYMETYNQKAGQFPAVIYALRGETRNQVWLQDNGDLLLTVAVPVQHYKQVLGALMVSRSGANVDNAIANVRIDVLRIFCGVLFITILLSLYLARTIAQPVKLLAEAVEGVRRREAEVSGLGGAATLLSQREIPDFSARADEIGELSAALRALTQALVQRIGAIENFAADVAHEIKNPLTSLRSAVETAGRVKDPEQQQKLMAVIRDDVDRLDRLISDISTASRLDAELSRAEMTAIDLGKLLSAVTALYGTRGQSGVKLVQPVPDGLTIKGIEGRLTQVFSNLIDNALSFSPKDGLVNVHVRRDEHSVTVTVIDQGPGMPENKLADIFNRFYTERPRSEKFGTHSGLGLSIAKQIVEAHRGQIWAENNENDMGGIIGAQFFVKLPLAGG